MPPIRIRAIALSGSACCKFGVECVPFAGGAPTLDPGGAIPKVNSPEDRVQLLRNVQDSVHFLVVSTSHASSDLVPFGGRSFPPPSGVSAAFVFSMLQGGEDVPAA